MSILSGYKRVCRRNIGGVSLIAVTGVQDIKTVTIEEGVVVSIETEKGFKEYQSSLDNAEFKVSSQEQSITFRFNALEAKSSMAYNELLDAAACGLVALVQMNNGAVALVGWSEEFEGRRPLMAIEADGTSGKAITDDNHLDVTLKTTQVTAPLFLSDELAETIDTLISVAEE